MRCPNCGSNIADNSPHCEFCGTKINLAKAREKERKDYMPIWFALAIIVGLSIIFTGVAFIYQRHTRAQNLEIEYQTINAKNDSLKNVSEQLLENPNEEKEQTVEGQQSSASKPNKQNKSKKKQTHIDEEEPVFAVVESMPEFPGGQEALFKYLSENVKYPVSAQEKGIQGRAICQFVVDKDGSICDVKIVRTSGDTSLDNEAMRVVKSMPKWTPGQQRGKPVRVKYTMPVSFRLQ